MLPTETWVVETGNPRWEAPRTSAEVARFAARPVSGRIRAMSSAIVRVTRRAATMPPSAMAAVTARAPLDAPMAEAPTTSPRILGVSFRPRANETRPALMR
jgi:hypothetical protein